MKSIIDTHIHFDQYKLPERRRILRDMDEYKIDYLISVSTNFSSAKANLALYEKDARIKPAFGYHPEQELPTDSELADLFHFIEKNHTKMVAIGEVGLPYYSEVKNKDGYIELLEEFFKLAKKLDKPVALHAIYEDAPTVINLLEKYSIEKAHYHWFKGDPKTLQQMAQNGYFISFTPDILYEEDIQIIAKSYPITQVMVETDGPWPFDGPFKNKMTHPNMIHKTIDYISKIKSLTTDEMYEQLYKNTSYFYSL